MNDISKENLQKMDLESVQAMESKDQVSVATPEDVFGNPVILKHILKQLANSKLLELSLVSKFWKQQARIVMKNRGNVMALLNCNDLRFGTCGQALKAFAANLDTLNEPMYSGMTIQLCWIRKCEGTRAVDVEAIHESIITGMRGKLKRLSIQLDSHSHTPEDCWNNSQNCPDVLLLRLLLRDLVGDLEHLKLELRDDMEPFVQQFLPHGPYPKLKVLKIRADAKEEPFGNQIRILLSRAPNLQQIYTQGCVSLREKLMEGREGVVHGRESYATYPKDNISENVIPSLRLKWLRFFYTVQPERKLDRFNEKTQSLLRTCCARTLVSLDLDAVSTVLLMSYGIPLVNVKYLWIDFDYFELEQFDRRILSILSRFDFTYLFPNLDNVVIWRPSGYLNLGELSRDTMDAIIDQANAVRTEPTLHRAGNISILTLCQASIPIAVVQFFAHMFPAIQQLDVTIDARDEIFPVESAWELCPDLKRIKLKEKWHERP